MFVIQKSPLYCLSHFPGLFLENNLKLQKATSLDSVTPVASAPELCFRIALGFLNSQAPRGAGLFGAEARPLLCTNSVNEDIYLQAALLHPNPRCVWRVSQAHFSPLNNSAAKAGTKAVSNHVMYRFGAGWGRDGGFHHSCPSVCQFQLNNFPYTTK